MIVQFALQAGTPQVPAFDSSELMTALGARSVRFLGSGSFGESWAFDTSSGVRVAKVLNDVALRHRERILREIEALRRVSSPHVVRLLEVQQHVVAIRKRPFLIFQYVAGGDVWSHMTSGRWPTPEEAQEFATRVLEGLRALHAQDVVHRDIKPENIALESPGQWARPVVLDLGISKPLDLVPITIYPARMGTAPYMAPEVLEQRGALKSSDLWSLGVTIYLLLAHRHPFYDDPDEPLTPEEALDRLNAGCDELDPALPATLRKQVMKWLSVTPHARGSAAKALEVLGAGSDDSTAD